MNADPVSERVGSAAEPEGAAGAVHDAVDGTHGVCDLEDGEDPSGGLLLFSPQGRTQRRIRTVKHPAGGRAGAAADAIQKLRHPDDKAPEARALKEALWLREVDGSPRRAAEATVGEDLLLECTVHPAQAPDGTAVTFTVTQHVRRDGEEVVEEVAKLEAVVAEARARARWKLAVRFVAGDQPTPRPLDARLSFLAEAKGDKARAPFLDVRSFVDVALVAREGDRETPIAGRKVTITLPHGIERTVETDAEGRVRLKAPLGQAVVRLAEDASGSAPSGSAATATRSA